MWNVRERIKMRIEFGFGNLKVRGILENLAVQGRMI
jgi:hypothetical protein